MLEPPEHPPCLRHWKTSVSERWLTSSTRLSQALFQHRRPPSPSGGSPLQPGCTAQALCQHRRPPSPSGGSPLQPGCLKRCVNTEDLRLRAVAHLFNPAVSSVVSTQKTSVSERWLTSSTRLSQESCRRLCPTACVAETERGPGTQVPLRFFRAALVPRVRGPRHSQLKPKASSSE